MAYTYDELVKMGATPSEPAQSTGRSYTYEELQGMGAKPVNYTALQEQLEPPKEQGVFSSISKVLSRPIAGKKTVGDITSIVAGPIASSEYGKKAIKKSLEIGAEGLKSTAKPFVQPFAMATGRDIPALDIKATPTPGEALEQAAGAALFVTPVEKVIAPVIKPIAKMFSGIAKRMGGTMTGKGVEVIQEIIDNPEVALKGMGTDEIKILEENASKATNEIIRIDRQANSDYAKALENLPKRLGALPKVMSDNLKTTIKVDGQTYVLSKKGVKSFMTERLRDLGVIVDPKLKYFDFTESPLRGSEENILKEVFNTIDKWTDTTPKGLNNLAVKIGNYKKAGDQSELLNGIIGSLKKNVRDYLGSRIPMVKKMNADYGSTMDTLEALRSELSVPNNLKTREGLIKTANKIQLLFSGNKQLERELIKEMAGGTEIIASEAGRQVAQAPSRASSSIGDSFRSLFQTVVPPKAIGQIAAYSGIAEQKIKPLIEVMKKLAPVEREALFNLFRE